MSLFHAGVMENLIEFMDKILSISKSQRINEKLQTFILTNMLSQTILNYNYDGDPQSFVTQNYLEKVKIFLEFTQKHSSIWIYDSYCNSNPNDGYFKATSESITLAILLKNQFSDKYDMLNNFVDFMVTSICHSIQNSCSCDNIKLLSLLLANGGAKFASKIGEEIFVKILDFYSISNEDLKEKCFDHFLVILHSIYATLNDKIIDDLLRVIY